MAVCSKTGPPWGLYAFLSKKVHQHDPGQITAESAKSKRKPIIQGGETFHFFSKKQKVRHLKISRTTHPPLHVSPILQTNGSFRIYRIAAQTAFSEFTGMPSNHHFPDLQDSPSNRFFPIYRCENKRKIFPNIFPRNI
jgi:hypothetical protein